MMKLRKYPGVKCYDEGEYKAEVFRHVLLTLLLSGYDALSAKPVLSDEDI